MMKKVLSLSLGIFLLTGTSALALTGPINTKSSGTTLYSNFNNGLVSCASGTVTSYAVAKITAETSLYQGSTRIDNAATYAINTHYVLTNSRDFLEKPGQVYSAKGYHVAVDKGVTYTHTSVNPK